MGIKILGATFGDQLAQRDVTQSIKSKASEGTLDVTANEELIPAFDVSTETTLDNADLAVINKKAQEQCQGGADSACMTSTKAALMREKHAEKARTDTSAANVIVGRALTVTYQDENNKVRRTVVPDGQKLKLANISGVGKPGEPEPDWWAKALERYQKAFGNAISITLWTLTFVFSVAASYRIFTVYGNLPVAIGVTLIAVLIPLLGGSPLIGTIFVMVAFGFVEMARLRKAQSAASEAGAPGVGDLLGGLGGKAGGLGGVLGGLGGKAGGLGGVLGGLGGKAGGLGGVLGGLGDKAGGLGGVLGGLSGKAGGLGGVLDKVGGPGGLGDALGGLNPAEGLSGLADGLASQGQAKFSGLADGLLSKGPAGLSGLTDGLASQGQSKLSGLTSGFASKGLAALKGRRK